MCSSNAQFLLVERNLSAPTERYKEDPKSENQPRDKGAAIIERCPNGYYQREKHEVDER
jgi:hypothetical protein